MRRVLHVQGDRVAVSEESRFATEGDLQGAVAAHPEALPSEDLGLGPLVALGTEVNFGAGPIDLLTTDPQGRLAIVEFKRGSENPDVRKVIAQMLDYGSSLWRRSYDDVVERCAQGRLEGAGSLEAWVADGCRALDALFDPGTFRDGLERCLDAGDFAFLYVARDLDAKTRRIMTYLAEGPRMSFLAVEVDYYRQTASDHAVIVPRTAFVPSWITGPSAPPRAPGAVARATLENAPPEMQELMARMDALAPELGLRVQTTRAGRNYEPPSRETGFAVGLGIGIYSSRGAQFNLEVFRKLGAADVADEMLARIERLTGVRPTASSWPAIDCDTLNRNWEQARVDLIEPYFDARAELVKRHAESAA